MSTYEQVIEYEQEHGQKDYQLKVLSYGSVYHFIGSYPDHPTRPNITLIEAYMEGKHYIDDIDNLSRSVQIYKISTGEKFSLEQAREILEGAIINYGLCAVALPLLKRAYRLESILRGVEVATQKR